MGRDLRAYRRFAIRPLVLPQVLGQSSTAARIDTGLINSDDTPRIAPAQSMRIREWIQECVPIGQKLEPSLGKRFSFRGNAELPHLV